MINERKMVLCNKYLINNVFLLDIDHKFDVFNSKDEENQLNEKVLLLIL